MSNDISSNIQPNQFDHISLYTKQINASLVESLRAPSTTAISIATAMCSQIAVAVDGLPTHAATDLFNLSQFSDSNNVGPRPWWPNRPPNIRKFWSTATATAICKSWWWLRLLEPIHGKFGRGCRWKSRLRLKIAVVDGALFNALSLDTAFTSWLKAVSTSLSVVMMWAL